MKWDSREQSHLILAWCILLPATTSVRSALALGLCLLGIVLCMGLLVPWLRHWFQGPAELVVQLISLTALVTVARLFLELGFPNEAKDLAIFSALLIPVVMVLTPNLKYGPIDSGIEALGYGCGGALGLLVLSSLREVLGKGSWLGIPVLSEPMTLISQAPGGFLFAALMAALLFILCNIRKRRNAD